MKDKRKPKLGEDWIPIIETIFPEATFIGWASVASDGKVDISKIEEKPIYASVPIFLPKDQMQRYKEFNEEQKEDQS